MRSRLGKAIRKQFTVLLREKLPQFKSVKPKQIDAPWGKTRGIPQGDRLYLWEYSNDLYFYIELSISPKFDAFDIGGAWTQNGRFPAFACSRCPYGIPQSGILPQGPENGDMRFRIADLIQIPQFYGWEVAKYLYDDVNEWINSGEWREDPPPEISIEDAMRNVEPCIEDALDKVIKYIIPYYEKIIEDYRKDPDFSKKYKKY